MLPPSATLDFPSNHPGKTFAHRHRRDEEFPESIVERWPGEEVEHLREVATSSVEQPIVATQS